MLESISHDSREETPEAKARWFQSLPLSERMDLFCAFTDMILSVNPNIVARKPDAQLADAWRRRETMESHESVFYVLSRDDLIALKRAAGREVDLEDVRLLELDNENE